MINIKHKKYEYYKFPDLLLIELHKTTIYKNNNGWDSFFNNYHIRKYEEYIKFAYKEL